MYLCTRSLTKYVKYNETEILFFISLDFFYWLFFL